MPLTAAPCPSWLQTFSRGAERVDIAHFFSSPIVFCPDIDSDGHPLEIFAHPHASHCFLYVDPRYRSADVINGLDGRRGGAWRSARGYQTHARIQLSPTDLVILGVRGDLARHRHQDEAPWAILEVLDRHEGLTDAHGPQRLALLFACLDSDAVFTSVFQRPLANEWTEQSGPDDVRMSSRRRPPFAVVLLDDSHDPDNGDPSYRVNRSRRLERLAARARPEWLVVGRGFPVWDDYDDGEALMGNMRQSERRLHARVATTSQRRREEHRATTAQRAEHRARTGIELLSTLLRREHGQWAVVDADADAHGLGARLDQRLAAALAPRAPTPPLEGADDVVIVGHRSGSTVALLRTLQSRGTRRVSLLVPASLITTPDLSLRRAMNNSVLVRSIVWLGDVVRAILGALDTPAAHREYALITLDCQRVSGTTRIGTIDFDDTHPSTGAALLEAFERDAISCSSFDVTDVPWTATRFSPAAEHLRRDCRLAPLHAFAEVHRARRLRLRQPYPSTAPAGSMRPLLERAQLQRTLKTRDLRALTPRCGCWLDDVDEREVVREGDGVLFWRARDSLGAFLVGSAHDGWVMGAGLVRLAFSKRLTMPERFLLLAHITGPRGRTLFDAAGADLDLAIDHLEVIPPDPDAVKALDLVKTIIGTDVIDGTAVDDALR